VAGVDAARMYEATGIAVHPINTVFQPTWERADEVVLASRAPVSRSMPCSKLGETVS